MIPALREALEHTVVLINPCQNPDGHERFATWYNAHGAGRPEQFAYEHHEPWSITGRLNHNFFDLNRDLISLSQPESKAATRAFLEWHPQVLADHHGQTKEYFFPPPAVPINPNLPEKTTIKWLEDLREIERRRIRQIRVALFCAPNVRSLLSRVLG